MGLALLVILVLAGVTVPVPFVALGRGPTYDTLGVVEGTPVVTINRLQTFPTSGHLNMTTVSVTDGLTAAEALTRWASPDYQVEPRSLVFPPDETPDQVTQKNAQDFADSQASAEGAALTYLKLPSVVYVDDLTDGSPSAPVLKQGDVLLSVNGQKLTTYTDLAAALAPTRPGQQVAVTYQRGTDAPADATITLGSRPENQQGALGVYPGVRPPDPDEIKISLGDVGGPSAGLMFSLAIVDKLTPGELNGGRFVAGTGTITSTGVVGKIEGIRFKMGAARAAGATVFLVPADNCADALDAAPDGLQLVKVASLPDAVTALQTLDQGGTPPSCSS
jgi:Lon-like protease